MAIKKIIAIASAKGGVGKSSVTALLAIEKAKNCKVAVLDADIYGPNQHLPVSYTHLTLPTTPYV